MKVSHVWSVCVYIYIWGKGSSALQTMECTEEEDEKKKKVYLESLSYASDKYLQVALFWE